MAISSPGRASRPAGPERGVTLIEMMIVAAIIALMAGVFFPSVSAGLESLRLRSASDSIASFLNGALNRAERRQQVIQIVVSLKENTIRLYSAEPGFERRLAMPDGVKIEAVLPAVEGGEETRTFLLQPGGTPPRAGIQIANRRGRRRIVRVDPMTGVPRIEIPEAP